MKSVKLFRTYFLFLVCTAALLLAVACGSTSPAAPSPTPDPAPAPAPAPTPPPPAPTPPPPAPTPPPAGPGKLAIEVSPNPVPYSGAPVSGCSSASPHTWTYNQVLRNVGGTAFTLTRRANYFDGSKISEPSVSITIQPGQSHTQPTAWCSSQNIEHTTRTDWFGEDTQKNKVDLTGPTIRLSPR
jgi:hypothetical protein